MEKQKKSYNLVIGIAALIAIILVIAIVGYFVSKPKPLVIQGEAEASEYRVSGKVPGRIEELYVKEGQRVQKGDTIAFIEVKTRQNAVPGAGLLAVDRRKQRRIAQAAIRPNASAAYLGSFFLQITGR